MIQESGNQGGLLSKNFYLGTKYQIKTMPKSHIIFCKILFTLIKLKLCILYGDKHDYSFLTLDEIIPEYNTLRLYKHGFRYDSPNFSLLCQSVTVFSDAGENVYPTKIYCRKTTQCRCQMQPDTHDLALFIVGK